MKSVLTLFFSILLLPSAYAQTTINKTMSHSGLTREYRLYIPAIYNASTPTPLVLNLHGYTSNNVQQEYYGDFRSIADTAGFIIVHPNGTFDGTSNRFWNVGFFPSTVDDIGFLEALIDTISLSYNINPARVYSTGMSNGGFMSYLLACQSDKIAAIASVTGSMSNSTWSACSPSHNIPAMEIHGTADGTVPYAGGSGIQSIANVINYWVTFNNCPTPPTITNVPDIAPLDGATAEHHVYSPGDNGVTVELFRVVNGGHTWPGAPISVGTTCLDFSASAEIWRFFNQFTLITGKSETVAKKNEIAISPVPTQDDLRIKMKLGVIRTVTICNLAGQEVVNLSCSQNEVSVDLRLVPPGIYILRVSDGENFYSKRIVKI